MAGRGIVAAVVAAAAAGEKVGSVASFGAATQLSTGSTVALLGEFIAAGLVVSERGPAGGYWRTATPVPQTEPSAIEELAQVRRYLRLAQEALHRLETQMASSTNTVVPLPDEDVSP